MVTKLQSETSGYQTYITKRFYRKNEMRPIKLAEADTKGVKNNIEKYYLDK